MGLGLQLSRHALEMREQLGFSVSVLRRSTLVLRDLGMHAQISAPGQRLWTCWKAAWAIQDLGQVIPMIVGAVAGLLPILLTAVITLLEKRSMLSRRMHALNLAHQRVEFLSAWVKAQEPLCAPGQWEELKGSVSEELLELRQHLTEVLGEEQRRSSEEAGEKSLLQKLLLLYRPRSTGGWVLHALFYMCLGMTILWALPTEGFDMGTSIITAIIFGLIPALVFRQLAAIVDRRADQQLARRLAAGISQVEAAGTGRVAGHERLCWFGSECHALSLPSCLGNTSRSVKAKGTCRFRPSILLLQREEVPPARGSQRFRLCYRGQGECA